MTRRWRPLVLLIALVTPAIVVVGSVDASRAPSQVTVTYQVTASRAPRMCVGTDATFQVGVDRLIVSPNTPALERHSAAQPQRDVVLEATSGDESVATVGDPVQIVGLDGSQPPVATFKVHGERDGTTTITILARIAAMAETDGWRGDTRDQTTSVTVVVTNCSFVLNTVSLWKIPGEANIEIGTTIENAVLEPNEEGVYRQLAPVTWYLSVSGVGECTGTLTADSTDAAIYASIDGSGQLDVEVKWDPVTMTITIDCRGIPGNMEQVQQPAPLVFTVSTRGGSRVQAHTLSGQAGKTRWWVEPIESTR